jgi:hypothetical protein
MKRSSWQRGDVTHRERGQRYAWFALSSDNGPIWSGWRSASGCRCWAVGGGGALSSGKSAGALVGGWLWDGLAIQFGVWYYSPDKIIGWWLLGMPIEEWIWIAGVTLLFGSVTVGLMGAVE